MERSGVGGPTFFSYRIKGGGGGRGIKGVHRRDNQHGNITALVASTRRSALVFHGCTVCIA